MHELCTLFIDHTYIFRSQKRAGVINKQRILFVTTFVGFFVKLTVLHSMEHKIHQALHCLWVCLRFIGTLCWTEAS
jgi:hypothetical protein